MNCYIFRSYSIRRNSYTGVEKMSFGSGIPAPLTQGSGEVLDIEDPQEPQPAILYLLHEATKLALPEAQQDCPDSSVLDGTCSREWSESHKRCPSPSASTSSSHFSLNRVNHTDSQNCFKGSFSLLPSQPGSSPWVVMSLINLQCERLLHPEDGEEDEAESLSTAPASEDTQSAIMACKSRSSRGASHFNEGDASPVAPWNDNAEEFAEALGSKKDKACFMVNCGRNLGETESVQHNKYKGEGSLVRTQVTVITDRCDSALNAYRGDPQAISSVQVSGTESGDTYGSRNPTVCKENEDWLLHGRREMPVVSNSDGKQQGSSHCAPQSKPDLAFLESMVHQESQWPESSFSAHTDKLACPSSAFCTSDLGVSLVSGQGVNVDSNSNVIYLDDMPPEDAQSQSGPQAPLNKSNCESVAQKPEARESLLAFQSKPYESYVENMDEEQLKLKANHSASDVRRQARKPRKQSHPTRSADLCDPNFKGVTFRMCTELNDNRDQCRLLITSNYSAELLKSIKRVRSGRTRSFTSSLKTSSSEEDSDSPSLSKNKQCASCSTKKTPLWRDAEDGTPLCNACGIRYKKYRVRCFQCWHIPRKEGNSDSRCCRCGDVLRLGAAQRKLSGW